MTLGQRIEARRTAIGISQAELARRVGLRQSTINSLINGDSRSSRSILQIARELGTTPAFLAGETDDPDLHAPPPAPPGPQVVMLGVVLPPERALARMFEVLLAGLPQDADRDEQALLLARRLPIGLAQLRDLLPEQVTQARASAPALATLDAEPQR